MAQVGTAYIDFEGRYGKLYRQTDSAVRQVESRFGGVGKSLTRGLGGAARAVGETLSVGLAAGATAVTALGTSAIVAGGKYNTLGQRATAAMTTVLGSGEAANKMMGELMEFASQSPFPRQAFVEASQQMLAFGFAAEDVVPTLGAVQDAVAAAGGTSQQMSEVVFVLSQIQAAGKITGQDLMQLGQRGINAADLIGQSMGMSGQQVRESITAGTIGADEAIKALTQGMSARFGGAAQNLKGTWTGAMDSIQARMRDMGAALMQPFIGFTGGGALVEGIGAISSALSGLITTAEDGSVRFTGALEPLNGVAQRLADKVLGLMTAVADFIANIDLSGVKSMFDNLGPSIGAVGGALGAALGGQIPILGSFLGGIHPVVAAIGGLIAMSPELRSVFGQAFSDVLAAIQPVIGPVMQALSTLGETLLPPLATLLVTLAQAAAPIIELLAQITSEVLSALQPALDALMPVLSELILTIGEAFLEVLEALAPHIPDLAQAFADLVIALLPLVEAIIPLIPPFLDLLDLVIPLIPAFIQLVQWITPLIGLVASLAGVVLNAAGSVLNFVTNIGQLPALLGELPGKLGGLASSLWGWITQAVPGALGALGGFLGSILGWVAGAIPQLVGAFLGWASAALSWVGRTLGQLPGQLLRMVGYVVGFVLGAAASLIAAFLRWGAAALGWIANVVTSLPGRLWNLVKTIWNWITGTAVPAVTRFFTQMVPAALRWIWDVVTSLPERLGRIGSAIWNWITETAVPAMTEKVKQLASSFLGWAREAVSGLPEKLGQIWSTIWDWLKELPGKILDKAKEIGSALVDGIKEGVGDLGGGFLSGLSSGLGLFAAGGYITRPTLGIIGEAGPELVLPLNDPARMQQLLSTHVPGFRAFQTGGAVGTTAGTAPAEPVVGTDVSGLEAWAVQAAAIFANLGIQIDTWIATTVAALTNWAATLVPTGTLPRLSVWAERVAAILTTLRAQITAGLTGLSAQVQALVNALLIRLQALVTAFTTRLTAAMTALSTRLIGMLTTFNMRAGLLVSTLSTRVTTTFQNMASRVSSILTAASGQWHTISATAAQRIANNITTRLSSAGGRVAQIVSGYARSLANGLNPILEAIGERKIAFRNGAVVTYARGGINGRSERHIAQIAPAGAMRVWAEPETGGEAYIPLARAKRGRSRAIAAETVRRLGGDVSWFQGGGITGNTQGLNPTFLARVRQWVAAVGQPFHITSGYRDIGRQAQLYQAYLAGRGNLAAKPGSSMHNFGLAIDGPHWGSKNPGAFGLVYRVRGEPWHVEPVDAKALKGGAAGDAFGFAALPQPPATPAGTLGDVAKKAMKFAYDKAVAWSSQALANAAGDQSISGVAGVGQWRNTVVRALQIIGQPLGYVNDILSQMQRESGGNPSVVNKWDSNWHRGTPSVGLMQVIGPTYATHKHPAYDVGPYLYGVSTNPLANVLAGLRYSLARYGDLGHFRRRGFKGYAEGGLAFAHRHDFDRGGVLRPGLNLVENNTGAPERLVPSEGDRTAVAIQNAHFHEGVDYDMFLRKTAFMLRAGRI